MTDHAPLYHYTDEKGLFGILKERQIYATNYHYFDDPTELSYALKQIRKRIKLHKKLDLKFVNLDFIRRNIFHVAVFSLSTDGDLLSQWRGYCPKGGYAIRFDHQPLKTLLGKPRGDGNKLSSVTCVYDENKQNEMIDDYIMELHSNKVSDLNLNQFILFCLSMKHPKFYEECEHRIVSTVISPQFNAVNK